MFSSKDLQKLVPKMREKGFYISQEQRKIDWPAYTSAQINEITDTIRFIKTEVDKVHTPEKHKNVGRPPTDAGILAKAILFVELFGIPERKAEGWIFLIGHHLGISEHIDDRVLGKAYKRFDVINILEKVFKSGLGENKNANGASVDFSQFAESVNPGIGQLVFFRQKQIFHFQNNLRQYTAM